MKVNLPIEEGYFNIAPNKFCGLDCYLITPDIDAKWNKNNLFYRSLITDKEGNVLSSGFPKFFNYGEKPECYPSPEDYNDWRYEDKIDGSLLIADYVNDTFSMRTRGTVSYAAKEHAKDFELLTEKYPKVVDFLKENSHLSLLFEIVSPNNVIVVRPKEIEFYLIGAINKNGMVVVSPNDLTNIWRKIGPIPAPKGYNFLDAKNLKEIEENVKYWKGQEGIVISYNNGQNRIKLKSDWYKFIHRAKSKLSSKNNLLEYYLDLNMPSFEDFYRKIELHFDFEIANQLEDLIRQVCESGDKAKIKLNEINEFIVTINNLPSRRDQADQIFKKYEPNKLVTLAFSKLDGKSPTRKDLHKLLIRLLDYEQKN